MEQNSDEWLKWRQGGIGSSDVPVILGLSKYSTPYKLWLQKIGATELQKESYVTELGHRFEPRMIAQLNLEHELDLSPAVVQHSGYPYLRASLDGCDFEKHVFAEVKFVGVDKLNRVKENQKPDLDHYAQMQHQFLVTGFKKAIYSCYTLDDNRQDIVKTCTVLVKQDKNFIAEMLPKITGFWQLVVSGKEPPLSKDDVKIVKNKTFQELGAKYIELKHKAKELADELDDIKRQLEEKVNDKDFRKVQCGNIMLTNIVARGSIDYKKIPELRDIDLEKYRGKTRQSLRIDEIV